ncbi:hypothetical protein AMATHDRAFT_76489 [Amanita thiersii Skay4041]|uniref:Zn(2)-C6 fungal-type domain-containing protein n=1 Tax=Amanita thiersii Skay4041 TaxID=703135 RepID=A0A2A9NMG4_9AGAR|nr:hypothetical protein AMATHDRAFT_76489 [Amanita thiersii Skay4041]
MSSSEQPNKQPQPQPNQDHPFPPPVVAYTPQPFNGATYTSPPPPGAYPPPFIAYPPPPDANHPENGQNGVPPMAPPYMMAFPPPDVPVPPGAPVQAPAALIKPKRKQVKMACTNCAAACKRCDEGRPCERCQKYGIGDTCRDGQRKERKKGIKRGPYKRKNKNGEASSSAAGSSPSPQWNPAAGHSPATATTTAAIHAVAQFASPEGYYGPIYYPPPGAFLPHHPHEVPSGQEGSQPPANGQPPMMPYFLHAGIYPPYPTAYGHPALYPGALPPAQQPQQQPQPPQQHTQPQPPQPAQPPLHVSPQAVNGVEPSSVAEGKKKEGSSTANGVAENAATPGPSGTSTGTKKRTRGKGGEPKAKRTKVGRAGKDKEGGGGQDGSAGGPSSSST